MFSNNIFLYNHERSSRSPCATSASHFAETETWHASSVQVMSLARSSAHRRALRNHFSMRSPTCSRVQFQIITHSSAETSVHNKRQFLLSGITSKTTKSFRSVLDTILWVHLTLSLDHLKSLRWQSTVPVTMTVPNAVRSRNLPNIFWCCIEEASHARVGNSFSCQTSFRMTGLLDPFITETVIPH